MKEILLPISNRVTYNDYLFEDIEVNPETSEVTQDFIFDGDIVFVVGDSQRNGKSVRATHVWIGGEAIACTTKEESPSEKMIQGACVEYLKQHGEWPNHLDDYYARSTYREFTENAVFLD